MEVAVSQAVSSLLQNTYASLLLLHFVEMYLVKIRRVISGLILYYLGTMSLSTLCNSCSLKTWCKFYCNVCNIVKQEKNISLFTIQIVTLIRWIILLLPLQVSISMPV
jgi:hypothetical protein